MFKNLKREEGFTLIELLVVIVIIGILIAVAAPSFLGQQDKAKDSNVKQDIAVIYKAAKAATVDNNGDFPVSTGSSPTLASSVTSSESQLSGKVTNAATAAANPSGAGNYTVFSAGGDDLVVKGVSSAGGNPVYSLTVTNGVKGDIVKQ